ncbi:substrate-binding periplasmic protein [Paramagnetospirillum kuznetsovii]|nr:transporter substrate-binding domain-containing protein [Paramagnetospirillum kuznetsovii]
MADARDLVVGVEAIDYSPVYGYRDGQFIGAGRAVLDAFATAKGHRLSYQAFPIKRLLAELIHGGIDLKFPDSPNWQTAVRGKRAIAYSDPVIAYIDGTIVRADRAHMGVDAVTRIGTVAGFTPFAWQDRIAAGKVTLTENPSFEALLRQLQTGRIDGAYANVAVALDVADTVLNMQGGLVFASKLPNIHDSYLLSSAKSPEVIAEFNDWLAKNQKQVADIIAASGAERGVR